MTTLQLIILAIVVLAVGAILVLPIPVGNPTDKICKEGVYYYSSKSRMSPAYNVDGTLQLCNVHNN